MALWATLSSENLKPGTSRSCLLLFVRSPRASPTWKRAPPIYRPALTTTITTSDEAYAAQNLPERQTRYFVSVYPCTHIHL